MQFTLGALKNDEQVILKTFQIDGSSNDKIRQHSPSKIINVYDLKNSSLHGLLFSKEKNSDDFINLIVVENKYFPVRNALDLQMALEQFESLSSEEGMKLFQKIRTPWVLQNNILALEDVFQIRNHLKQLWPNDRTGFFEEFWFFLKNQLGATELIFYYHDLIKATKEGEKNKLIKVKMTGFRHPSPQNLDEADEVVVKNYEPQMSGLLEMSDYNLAKGQLVIAGLLRKSSFLVLAKLPEFNRIQKALLTALFRGLNSDS